MTLRIVPLTLNAARRWIAQHHAHLDAPAGGMFCVGVETDGTTPHAASMAIGAIVRAARALGWRRVVSYTLVGEAGTSYRASGWHAVALSDGGADWSRKRRPRERPAQPGDKVRWETGPDAAPDDAEISAYVNEMAGRVALPGRARDEPLFSWRPTTEE